MALTRSILRSGIAASATGLLRAGMFRLDADAVTRALPDLIAFTAVGGAATDPVTGANVLLNDAPATSLVTEVGGVAIAGGGSATAAGSAGGSFEVWSDGACVFSPGADFAALPLGRTASSRVLYRTDIGGAAYLTALVTGSLQLAYELAVENGGAFGSTAGLLSPGLEVELTGLSPITAAVVGSVTRTAGGAGIAFLSFADDGAALQYAYTQSPEVDRVGVALAISVPTGAAGRVVETAAVGGGFFRVDVVGDNLVATVSDGSTLLTASRALPARDEPFGFTAALGPSSLLLALSGDAEGAVVATARGAYVAPTAETLRIGGPGADIFGGRLMHPTIFDAAGVATAAADVFAVYAAALVVADEAASTNVTFTPLMVDGVYHRLARLSASGSLSFTTGGEIEVQIVGGGGGGSGPYAQRPGGGGGAGEFVRTSATVDVGAYSVTVGAGGAGGGVSKAGSSGTLSRISGAGVNLTGLGGGAGGIAQGGGAASGGSGGGGGSSALGGASIASDGVGFAGGDGAAGSLTAAGGGGGAAAAGATSPNDRHGGDGGAGILSDFDGAAQYYAGGGGGASRSSDEERGFGGVGGGGNGGNSSDFQATAGAAGTGGGGGGTAGFNTGGAGGSGEVLVRWRATPP
jgi:hypothetical protein